MTLPPPVHVGGMVNTKKDFNCKQCGKMEIKHTLSEHLDTMHFVIITITSSGGIRINNIINNIMNDGLE